MLFLFIFALGFFFGVKAMYVLFKYKNSTEGFVFRHKGYVFQIYKEQKEKPILKEVLKEVKKEPKQIKCEFCQDEDIYIAGTKEKMPCPKCKRGTKNKTG